MKFKTSAAFVFASLAMTAGASAGWIDDYNATLNTPAARAAAMKSACGSTGAVDQVNCTYYKKYGPPISDVRYAIAAGSIIAGGVVGGVLHAHPGILGMNHLHVLGHKVTFVQAVAIGAGTGYVVSRVATHR
ncbi:hypothetical protein [Prosthecomicrobium sp. N25]|uniref:hypothetical protein n=1 Tax=Prosthecomicrobium sp. N25 TaxID=3129254 RepID=UPI0030789ACE